MIWRGGNSLYRITIMNPGQSQKMCKLASLAALLLGGEILHSAALQPCSSNWTSRGCWAIVSRISSKKAKSLILIAIAQRNALEGLAAKDVSAALQQQQQGSHYGGIWPYCYYYSVMASNGTVKSLSQHICLSLHTATSAAQESDY